MTSPITRSKATSAGFTSFEPPNCGVYQKGFNRLTIERLKEIWCYRKIKHEMGLPCRGQRTENNCRMLRARRLLLLARKRAAR
ncbi:unnamed protein product [Musa acuminata subsp. burmannicoides]